MLRVGIPLVVFCSSILLTNCDKKDSNQSSSAAVLEQEEGRLKVLLTAEVAQEFGSSSGTTNGTYVKVPAGVLPESVDLWLQPGTALADEYIQTTLDVDEDFTVKYAGPTIELRPDKKVALVGDVSITLPKGDIPETEKNLMVLYKGIDEQGIWRLGALGAAYLADGGQSVTINSPSFGRFQVVAIENNFNSNLDYVSPGAGPWYGIEFDLYSQFKEPIADGPDHSFFLFNNKGAIISAKANGETITPPPSFDFNALVSAEYPNIFDASSEVQVGLALFNEDFDYGIWVDFKTSPIEQQLTTRVMQRSKWDSLPTEAIDPASLVGNYKGLSATSTVAGLGSKLDIAYLGDQLELSYVDSKVSLTGALRQEEVTGAELSFTTGITAQALGFMTGTVSIAGKGYTAFMIPSFDRKAFAIIVCESNQGGSCPSGDGTGTYDARSLFVGIFERY